MPDITVDRLVVLIEAQTRSFESQIKRLEGQVKTSAGRMTSSFKGLNTQIGYTGSVLGRAFGIGGLGKAGVAGAMISTAYAVGRVAHAMGDLREESRKTGIAIDEAFADKAEKFAHDFETIPDRLKVVFGKLIGGGYTFGDFLSGKIKTELQPSTAQLIQSASKGDLLPQSHDFTAWDEADRVIGDLTKSFEKLRDASNDAAQGMTDSVKDFTHAIIDNPKDWQGALSNMLKGVSTDIVDAGLFGSGPYAKFLGTAGPGSGGPGGLVGDAFGSLLGNRSFGNSAPVPVVITGVEGSGATNLLGSFTGGIGGKDQSRIDALGGNPTPYGVLNAVAPTRGTAVGAAAANTGNPFLDMIASAEGTANQPGGGYNTSLGKGKFLPGGAEQNLTGMTLAQIDALQTGMRSAPGNAWGPHGWPSTALGRYQLTQTKLRELEAQQNLPGTTLFDQSTQDKLALLAAQGRGPDAAGLMGEWQGLTSKSPEFMSRLLANFPGMGDKGTVPVQTAAASAAIPPSALDWLLRLIPGFAKGGNFDGSHPIWAGERGRELIVPSAPGTVIPHGGSMGGRDVQIFDQRTNAPAIHQQRGPNGNLQLIVRDAMDANIRAGNHDKAMQSRYGAKPAQVGRT